MSLRPGNFTIPRPGALSYSHDEPPIAAPAETAFTDAFGKILPKAKYLNTTNGKAAYYEMLPSTLDQQSHPPHRVLFLHGVQTPALGMALLVRALHESFPQSHFVQVDLWGHGLSDTPVAPHEPSLFHQLIDALLDRLEWPSAHFVGYSFGGALTVGYAASRPARVQSFVLIAPAGLVRYSQFTVEQQGHLDGGGDEAAARKWILEWLEGGELIVPVDWKERVGRGEVIAEALRAWQIREHPGHVASVVSIIRDGGVMDKDALFSSVASSGVPSLAILGETDDVCSEQELKKLGFSNVTVIPQTGHAVVRQRRSEVKALISSFWTKLS
jgi:pimeloyl-ACP methyl ester carboxylesterase